MPDTDTRTPAQRAADLRTKLLERADELRTLRELDDDKRSDTWPAQVVEATRAIHSLDAELRAIELQAETKEQARGPRAAFADTQAFRTPGDVYVEDAAYSDHGRYRGGNLPDIKVAHLIGFRHVSDDIEYRALISTETSDPAGGLWMPRGTPLPPLERRQRLFVRDVLSVVGTTLNSVPYLRELNPATNETGATAVAEGSPKPEVTMQFVQDDAPIRKIAAWIPVTSEVVDDAPTLRGYIDTRLAYMLALREEQQILNGPAASAPNLKGIRNFTGLQTQAEVTGDYFATIGRAIGKIENVDGEPDAFATNPLDFWLAMTTRHANQFDSGQSGSGPFGTPQTMVYGLRAIRTRSMEATKALVGSFRLGATLFDRQETVIRVGDQHSDYFTSNKLVILAEERVGLAVHRPDFFVEATVPDGSA
jgi:HK97 family phage major capsid protein